MLRDFSVGSIQLLLEFLFGGVRLSLSLRNNDSANPIIVFPLDVSKVNLESFIPIFSEQETLEAHFRQET